MIELTKKSSARAQRTQQQEMEARTAVNPIAAFTIVAATALLAVLGWALLLYAQGQGKGQGKDRYSLTSPGGIAFSDFRGYEDWSVVSSARTEAALPEEILKVIVANPTMIKAFKAGVPGNGQPFPDGSMIAKLQWQPKKSTEAPFAVDVPDVVKQAFVMEKDSKSWGYAVFNYDASSDTFSPDAGSPADCGYACHIPVKAKDYIFHPYQKR